MMLLTKQWGVSILLLAGLLTAFGQPLAQTMGAKRYAVRDYGAIADDQIADGDAIQRCLKEASSHGGPSEIVFEAGDYRIDVAQTEKRFGEPVSLVLQGGTRLVLRGVPGKTRLVFTNPSASGLHLEECSEVRIQDLVIDYDPLPYAQGTIRNVDGASGTFDLELDATSLDFANPAFATAKARWGFVIRPDPVHDVFRYGPVAVGSESFQRLDRQGWRLTERASPGGGYEHAIDLSGMRVGDRYVHLARTWGSALAIIRCQNVRIENVTILSSPGLAFFPHLSRGVTLAGCRVRPLAGRPISTNADGVHARGMRGDLTLRACSFEGMGDDAINLHSSSIQIGRVLSSREVIATAHTWSVVSGDVLSAVDGLTLREKGRATVEKVETTAEGVRIVLGQGIEGLRENKGASADRLYNLSEAGGPFIVTGCYFGAHRGRAIVLSGREGVICGNRFENNEGWGIDMSVGDTIWAEGPPAGYIKIEHNIFIGRGGPEPSISCRWDGRREFEPRGLRPFEHLLISDNEFVGVSMTAIRLWGVNYGQIEGNQISNSYDVTGKAQPVIDLENCSHIALGNLKMKGSPREPQIRVGATVDPGEEGFRLLGEPSAAPSVLDLRPH